MEKSSNSKRNTAYRNVMELLVEQRLELLWSRMDCCHCDRCHDDIISYALNRLPPKYVVTDAGEAYSKTYALGQQHDTDIVTALMQGVNIVKAHPRHSQKDD